jgi:hypothetical protein
MGFKENLDALPVAEGRQLVLFDDAGVKTAVIANAPGSAGSFKLYAYLANKYGGINPAAAEDGLRLYAEHTDDARQNPGRHPNIDRLLLIQSAGKTYSARVE